MNPYFSYLLDQKGIRAITQLSPETLKLTAGEESPTPSFYWFYPYKSEDFEPLATNSGVTKDYFFLFGTDHDSASGGQIRLAQGNSLALDDFEDLGIVKSGDQNETPILIIGNDVGDGEIFNLYFHTTKTASGNGGKQQTRLYTTDNKSLIGIQGQWTDRGRPLYIAEDENHTGYFFPFKRSDNDWIGPHVTHDLSGDGARSAYDISIDGRNWTRFANYPVPNNTVYSDYHFSITSAYNFQFNQKFYSLSSGAPFGGEGNVDNQRAAIAEIRISDLVPIKHVYFPVTGVVRSVTGFLNGNVLYIYIMRSKTTVSVKSFRLS